MTTDQLWQAAAAEGQLKVQSCRDSRGEYIRAHCHVITDDGDVEIDVTAATTSAALRAIIGWRDRPYYRIKGAPSWEPLCANEILAEKRLAYWRAQSPRLHFEIERVLFGTSEAK